MVMIILVSKPLTENATGFTKVRKLSKELGVTLRWFCCSLLLHPQDKSLLSRLMLMLDINFIIQSPTQEQHEFNLKGI